MPILDMPLSKLKDYMGITPCPADFDAYWDEALREMHSIDSDIKLVPFAKPYKNVECFDLYFTGVRGARVHARFMRPVKISEPAPAILFFHGYGHFTVDFPAMLAYAGQGFCCASLDSRGQFGQSEDLGGVTGTTLRGHIVRGLSSDDPHDLMFRSNFLDAAQLAKIVMSFPEVDEKRVATKGSSQGGALSLVCSALEPRIRKTVTLHPFLSDYKRVWQMDLTKDAYSDLRDYFRFFDPMHLSEDAIFEKLGYIDIKNLVGRIKSDVLFGITLMDNICPPSTQFAAFNHIVSPKKPLIFHDYAHESIPEFENIALDFLLDISYFIA